MLKIEQFPRFSLNASSRGPNVLFVFRLSHEPLSLRECVKVNLPRNYQGLKRLVKKKQLSNFQPSGEQWSIMREGLSRYTPPFVLIFNFSFPFPDGLTLLSLCPFPYLYLILCIVFGESTKALSLFCPKESLGRFFKHSFSLDEV